jgi:hypothetical protein
LEITKTLPYVTLADNYEIKETGDLIINMNYCNIYEYTSASPENYSDDTKLVTITSAPNMFIIFGRKNNLDKTIVFNRELPHIKNINSKIELKIGIFSDTEKELLQKILPSNISVNYVQVYTDTYSSMMFQTNELDFIVYFNTHDSPIMRDILKNDYFIVNYESVDKSIIDITASYPYIKSDIISLLIVQEGNPNQNMVFSLLFDNVIYCNNIGNQDCNYYKNELTTYFRSKQNNWNLQPFFTFY